MANPDSTSDTIQIQLTQGYSAIVDEQDADLNVFNWTVYIGQSGNTYARRARPKIEKGSQNIHMHRVILERILKRPLLQVELVDHENGNGLDNRRSNLRLATKLQNTWNQRISRDSTSGYKGVVRRENGTWKAAIQKENKRVRLGCYATAEEAACIYNYHACKLFGEFAQLNDVPNWEEIAKKLLSCAKVRRDNTSGFTGVRQLADGKWIALINRNKKKHYVGRFETSEAANEARQQYIKEHFE